MRPQPTEIKGSRNSPSRATGMKTDSKEVAEAATLPAKRPWFPSGRRDRFINRCVNGVCTCVLPLDRNDYRPLALQHKPLSIVSAVLIATKVLVLLVLALTPLPAELSTITVNRIVALTNDERVKVGLAPLAVNAQLAAAANEKAKHMLEEDYFAHISPSGVTPWFWMQKQNYVYQVAGENLAIDFVEAEDVVAAWIASPTHKDNLLHKSYTETGIAVVTGEYQGRTSTVVVHMFGLPATAAQPVVPEVPAPPATLPTVESESTPLPEPPASEIPEVAPDTEAPAAPRIAVANGLALVQSSVELTLESEIGSTVTVFASGRQVASIPLQNQSTSRQVINLSSLADGELALTATATDAAGNVSQPSSSISITKDTIGPDAAEAQFEVILNPLTDSYTAALTPVVGSNAHLSVGTENGSRPLNSGESLVVATNQPFSFTLEDEAGNLTALTTTVTPQFNEPATEIQRNPEVLVTRVRLISAGILVVVAILLAVAILVQYKHQRPSLIGHASFVIALATAFLLL